MANSKSDQSDVSGWVGWVYFAGFMMLLMGIFQSIAGLVALFKDEVYVVGPNNLWIWDYTAWGWTHLLLGLFIILAGMAVFSGKMWGRVIGIILTFFAAIVNFAFVPVYPLWSILLLVINGLVIYALIAHGKEAADTLE